MKITNHDRIIATALCHGLMRMDADYEYGVTRTVQEREEAREIAAAIRAMVPDLDDLAAICADLEHKARPHIAMDCPTSDSVFGPDLFRMDEYSSHYPEDVPWDPDSDEPEPPTWAESNGLAEVRDDFMRRLKLIRMEQRERVLQERRIKAAEKRAAKREAEREAAKRDAEDRDAYYRRQVEERAMEASAVDPASDVVAVAPGFAIQWEDEPEVTPARIIEGNAPTTSTIQ